MIPEWTRCPACHGSLAPTVGHWHCPRCDRAFPVVEGIVDLRLTPDPWIGMAEDRAKGARVLADVPSGFDAAVRRYWQLTPETEPALAARHIDHVLGAEARSRAWIATISPAPRPGERWLDVGCGTADLACAAPAAVEVVGVDVAFRWLCLGSRRLAECQRTGGLFAGNGEALPIAADSFDRVFLLGTVEHCEHLSALLREAHRVLRPGGWLHLRTTNRHSLLAEPHVGLWGVAVLPRRLADRYARWRGRGGYRHHWPRTARELMIGLREAGFVEGSIAAAVPLDAELHRLPRALRPLARTYGRTRHWSAVRAVAPLLEGRGRRP